MKLQFSKILFLVRELRSGVVDGCVAVTVSAINRKFPGRSGPGQVWLASPATVMASALAGRLASFDSLVSSRR